MGMTLLTATTAIRVDDWGASLSNGRQSMRWWWLSVEQGPAAEFQLLPVHLLPLMTQQLVDQHATDHGHQHSYHR